MMPPTGESICVTELDVHKKSNAFILVRNVEEKVGE